MPAITKQSPRDNGKAASEVSVLSGAIPVADIEGDWIRMSIYGGNRVGKTTLACQFPKPLLLVAFEPNVTGGAKSVRKVPGVVFLRLTSSAAGLQLCRELQDSGGQVPKNLRAGLSGSEFATYVVDGATSYQDIVLQEVMGWDKMPEQLAFGMVGKDRYQERAEKVKEGLRPFTNLPGHVVILAKEKDHNPPRDDYASLHKLTTEGGFSSLRLESFFAEDVGGSVSGWLHDVCDYVGRLSIEKEIKIVTKAVKFQGKVTTRTEQIETGRFIRRLRTMYHPNYAAGFRSENPDAVPEWINNPTYEKIAKVIRGEKL